MFTKLQATRNRSAGQDGFTLIELLVVILIIGILAAIALPKFLGPRDSAQDSQAKSSLRNAVTAAESWYTNNQTYDGLQTATTGLTAMEPGLSLAAADVAPGGTADPKAIRFTTGADVPTATTLIMCSASKGKNVFCVRLSSSGSAQYGKATTQAAAVTAAKTTTGSW